MDECPRKHRQQSGEGVGRPRGYDSVTSGEVTARLKWPVYYSDLGGNAQNSLPSTSAMTVHQRVPSSPRISSILVAPMLSSRSSSASWGMLMSIWTRFLTALASGTLTNQ